MAANILARAFKTPLSDRFSIDISADVHVRRVFTRLGLIEHDASNEELIYRARELNPAYPGVFDLPAWEVGGTWCRSRTTDCAACYLSQWCPTARAAAPDRHAG
ncbi:MAG: hypothetical protein U0821_17170 [Chloroflexota bacterium]